MTKYRNVTKCRLCNFKSFDKIINFGKVPLGNNLQYKKKLSKSADLFPLSLIKCQKCSHYQLSAMVNPTLLYATNYSYLTGVAPSFHYHFENYSNWIEKRCNLKNDSKILDIGSNDGTCLLKFKKDHRMLLGVDPAKLPAKIAINNKINTINDFFSFQVKNKIKKNYGEFDFITSHNVLAHIENIEDVFLNIYDLLKLNGFFCFEVGYFVEVIKNNFFDTIYHEHLDYHHAKPLVTFLKKIGFSILSIHKNKIQGGSIRVLCKKENKIKVTKQVKEFLLKETNFMNSNSRNILTWERQIKKNLMYLKKYLEELHAEGKIIAGYGAPTKATLLIKMLKLDTKVIKYIFEDNDLKVDRYLPSSGIRILSNTVLKKKCPDVMIIFAWNFVSDIIKKLKQKKIENIEILIPLPTFKKTKL